MPNLSRIEKKLIERLLSLKPSLDTLLEVGCGDGNKLIYLKTKFGIKVSGIDIYEPYIKKLNELGIPAEIGDARSLPYKDTQFGWVLIANSVHHIPNPEKALSEAIRVAKHGVIVVDPWYDKSIYSQQLSAELSAWCKKLHQSLGYFHRDGLSAGEIISAITDEVTDIEVYYEVLFDELNLEKFFQVQDQYMQELHANHYLLWELKQLKHKIEGNFVSEAGQVVVIIKK